MFSHEVSDGDEVGGHAGDEEDEEGEGTDEEGGECEGHGGREESMEAFADEQHSRDG